MFLEAIKEFPETITSASTKFGAISDFQYCLETALGGSKRTLWKPCRSNRRLFRHSLICNIENRRDCGVNSFGLQPHMRIDIALLRSSDICNPHFSWSSASMSSCIHISLLRLQEILLAKLTTGEANGQIMKQQTFNSGPISSSPKWADSHLARGPVYSEPPPPLL